MSNQKFLPPRLRVTGYLFRGFYDNVVIHIAMFFFNEIGKSIKCPRWILVKNEIQNRKIANLMNFSHANGEVRVLKTPRNHHKSKDHNFLHRSYTPKKIPAPNFFFRVQKMFFENRGRLKLAFCRQWNYRSVRLAMLWHPWIVMVIILHDNHACNVNWESIQWELVT